MFGLILVFFWLSFAKIDKKQKKIVRSFLSKADNETQPTQANPLGFAFFLFKKFLPYRPQANPEPIGGISKDFFLS